MPNIQGTFLVQLEGDRDHLLEELQQPGLLLSVQPLSETGSENWGFTPPQPLFNVVEWEIQ